VNGENPIQIGPFGAQLHASEYVSEGIPVLNVGNVWPSGIRLDSLNYVTRQKAESLSRYAIKADDLLFARSGATLGKVCLVPANCDGWLMTGHLFRVRFDPDVIDNRFAFAALRGARQVHEQVFGQVRGATRPGYNTTLLGAVRLPVPSVPDQRRIVADLDALQAKVDAVKALQTETAAELDAMLPAILDKAFKAEL
jgi:type I restriction enzyme S subunit